MTYTLLASSTSSVRYRVKGATFDFTVTVKADGSTVTEGLSGSRIGQARSMIAFATKCGLAKIAELVALASPRVAAPVVVAEPVVVAPVKKSARPARVTRTADELAAIRKAAGAKAAATRRQNHPEMVRAPRPTLSPEDRVIVQRRAGQKAAATRRANIAAKGELSL